MTSEEADKHIFELETKIKQQTDDIDRLEKQVKLLEEQFAKVFPRG